MTPRSYDASRRQAAARRSRERILDAARRRFLRDGYGATTVAAIARDADVAPQTVTKHFANKAGLVKALFDVALVGDDTGGPLSERPAIVEMLHEPDARAMLRSYAETLTAMLPRTAPIQLLLRSSGAPELVAVWDQIRAGRLAGMSDLATALAGTGALRDGVTVETARDVLWTYSSPDLYQLLVEDRGWPVERFTWFLVESTAALLIAPRSD